MVMISFCVFAAAALKWTQARWSSASKLLLQPSSGKECSALMSWASCHCHELGPLQQLGVVAIATSRSLGQYASTVAAMINLLALQVCMHMVYMPWECYTRIPHQ